MPMSTDEFCTMINKLREICGNCVVSADELAALIDKAREIYGDDCVEIDDTAFLHRRASEDGIWVSAWVFVPDVISEIED